MSRLQEQAEEVLRIAESGSRVPKKDRKSLCDPGVLRHISNNMTDRWIGARQVPKACGLSKSTNLSLMLPTRKRSAAMLHIEMMKDSAIYEALKAILLSDGDVETMHRVAASPELGELKDELVEFVQRSPKDLAIARLGGREKIKQRNIPERVLAVMVKGAKMLRKRVVAILKLSSRHGELDHPGHSDDGFNDVESSDLSDEGVGENELLREEIVPGRIGRTPPGRANAGRDLYGESKGSRDWAEHKTSTSALHSEPKTRSTKKGHGGASFRHRILSLPLSLKVGIVVGSMLVCAAFVLVVILLIRRKRAAHPQTQLHTSPTAPGFGEISR